MREILFEPMDPASARAAEYGLAGRVPVELDAWFSTATAREPEHRFPNAEVAFAELVKSTPSLASAASIPPPTMLSAPPAVASAPSQAAHATFPSPTLVATTAAAPPRAGSSLGLWVGVLGVVIALVAVVIAGVAVYFSTLRDETKEVVASARQAPPSPTAPVVVDTSAPAPSATAPGDASAPKKAPVVVKPAAPADPPFDLGAAATSVNAQANLSKFHCKTMQGPLAFSGVVHFKNPGGVSRSDFSDIQASSTQRGLCVRSMLNGARVKTFSGAAKPVPFAVGF
jgi:hypothetical protein